MKSYSNFISEESLYHGSMSDLDSGKTYTAKKNKGTFGDFEKIIEKNRPNSAFSRLESFYLGSKGTVADQAPGGALYKVTPVGKYGTYYFGWIALLQNYLYDDITGMKPGHGGYTLGKIHKEKTEDVKMLVQGYFSGKKVPKKIVDQFEGEDSIEFRMKEILAPKIKIDKLIV